MIDQITLAILLFLILAFSVVIIAFIILVRSGGGRPRRYNQRRRDQRRARVSSGYIPYGDSPDLQKRRRESAIVIGIVILFILVSILSFFL
jgi:uncharacterized membrane-anchored protein